MTNINFGDIREWAPEHAKMGKWVTLSKDELMLLKDVLNDIAP